MIETKLTELLDIRYPLFQGAWRGWPPMSWPPPSAKREAWGSSGRATPPPEWVQAQIDALRRKTARPFGVNVMLLSPTLPKSWKW